jgi:hypothetical protein
MGEGVLNEGYTGGGLLSDMQLPGVEVAQDATRLWFDWRSAFSRLFGEEMIMRRFGRELLRRFEDNTAGISCRGSRSGFRRTAFADRGSQHGFLRRVYQPLRRQLLVAWRDHLASSSVPAPPFDVARHIPSPLQGNYTPRVRRRIHREDCPTIQDIAFVEESMVFHIPGWEKWDVAKVAHLREREQRVWFYGGCNNRPPRLGIDPYRTGWSRTGWYHGGLGALGPPFGLVKVKGLDEDVVKEALRSRSVYEVDHYLTYFRYPSWAF